MSAPTDHKPKDDTQLKVVEIIEGTSVDGPGLRTSIYFAGCEHRCAECHNPQTWDADGGQPMEIDEIVETVRRNGFNVTFSGGDPLLQIEPLCRLAVEIKKLDKNIWCYTGYTYEEIVKSDRLSAILKYIDVLVDGRFEIEKKDLDLRFRGSSNQRIIDCKLSDGYNIVEWKD